MPVDGLGGFDDAALKIQQVVAYGSGIHGTPAGGPRRSVR
jgi:hypothetical protein